MPEKKSKIIEKLNKVLNIDNVIRKPYYYVPPCPCCNSKVTGRFVKNHRLTEYDWMMRETLLNGELIKMLPSMPEYETAFCVNCGYTWRAEISLRLLTISEINQERLDRLTDTIYCDMFNLKDEQGKETKQNFIKRFIGKL